MDPVFTAAWDRGLAAQREQGPQQAAAKVSAQLTLF